MATQNPDAGAVADHDRGQTGSLVEGRSATMCGPAT